jgi:hypothetical protein
VTGPGRGSTSCVGQVEAVRTEDGMPLRLGDLDWAGALQGPFHPSPSSWADQYLREISGDGVDFGLPRSFGGRITTVVAWSRILADREIVCAFNNDPGASRTVWVTVDAGLNDAVAAYGYDHSSEPGAIGTTTPVEPRNGRAIEVRLPPAGFAVLSPR